MRTTITYKSRTGRQLELPVTCFMCYYCEKCIHEGERQFICTNKYRPKELPTNLYNHDFTCSAFKLDPLFVKEGFGVIRK